MPDITLTAGDWMIAIAFAIFYVFLLTKWWQAPTRWNKYAAIDSVITAILLLTLFTQPLDSRRASMAIAAFAGMLVAWIIGIVLFPLGPLLGLMEFDGQNSENGPDD